MFSNLWLPGLDSAGWSEHRLRDGYSYFHNRQTGESQWERPEDFTGQSQDLSREEIQVRGRGGGGGGGQERKMCACGESCGS